METTFTIHDPDGFQVFVYQWEPDSGAPPRGVVQVAHGAAEHARRYQRFAEFLNQAGFVVFANDHRGHWRTAGSLDRAGIAGDNGWNGMVNDLKLIHERIKKAYPRLPRFLFGHSMGSFLAQQFIQEGDEELAGVVLSGTTGSLGENLAQTIAAVEQETAANGRNAPSAVFGAMFSGFAAPFPPVRTGFEWLSRDEAEVRKYVDDPWCGFPFSNGLVGDMLRGGMAIWTPESEARIPKKLPVLMVSGAMDPVGGFGAGVNLLAGRYQALGIQDLTVRLYPEARHEILNETNRDEVQRDVLQWFEKHL